VVVLECFFLKYSQRILGVDGSLDAFHIHLSFWLENVQNMVLIFRYKKYTSNMWFYTSSVHGCILVVYGVEDVIVYGIIYGAIYIFYLFYHHMHRATLSTLRFHVLLFFYYLTYESTFHHYVLVF
jgi:hypothetical protein